MNNMKKRNLIVYIVRFFLKEQPSYLFVVFAESIIGSLTYVFTSVYLLKILFDYIQKEIELQRIFMLLIFTAVLCLSVYLLNVIVNQYYKPRAEATLSEKIKLSIYKKYVELPLSTFETDKTDETYFFILGDTPGRFLGVIADLSALISQIVSIVFIIGILITIDWLIIIVIVAFSVLFYFLNLRKNKIAYEKEMAFLRPNREREYINRLFYLPQYAKEIRLTNISHVAQHQFEECYQDLSKKMKVFGKRIINIDLIIFVTTSLIFDLLILFYLTVQLLVYKLISIGDYTAVINSIWKLYGSINEIFATISKFKLHSTFIKKYIDFISLPSNISFDGTMPGVFEDLVINHVSYSYNNQVNAVDDVCLEIKAGEKIAIVGYNGAGKTTLIKLIMGLYEPQKGYIHYNGINHSLYDRERYIKKFRLVSQENNLYALTFAENVFMDNYYAEQKEQYNKACNDARLEDLIKKHQISETSKMTSEFDERGIQLSGGETQRVSISRLFSYDPAEIYVLDEPSSALDVYQESIINEILTANSMKKTLIVITHKLAIARQVDKIYFFDNGQIVESGNHAELMKQQGKYFELYNLQLESLKIFKNDEIREA